MGNLASIALMRGRLAEAERWGHQALESARQLEELEELEAEATYSLVLGWVAALTSRPDVARTHLSRGYAATALGLWDEAEAGFTEAHALFSHLELQSLVREATVGLRGRLPRAPPARRSPGRHLSAASAAGQQVANSTGPS